MCARLRTLWSLLATPVNRTLTRFFTVCGSASSLHNVRLYVDFDTAGNWLLSCYMNCKSLLCSLCKRIFINRAIALRAVAY
eukprot:75290-Chlamydomonas_euryale.AAC.1